MLYRTTSVRTILWNLAIIHPICHIFLLRVTLLINEIHISRSPTPTFEFLSGQSADTCAIPAYGTYLRTFPPSLGLWFVGYSLHLRNISIRTMMESSLKPNTGRIASGMRSIGNNTYAKTAINDKFSLRNVRIVLVWVVSEISCAIFPFHFQ